jgi:CotH kinase protein/Bacterial Ig-like domain (group 3)
MNYYRRTAEVYVLCAVAILGAMSAAYGQQFTLVAEPSSLTIYPGQQNVPVTITAWGRPYTVPITVTLTGLPSGIKVSPLVLTAGSAGTLRISASLSAGQEGFSPTTRPIPTSWTAPVTVVGVEGSTRVTSPLPLTVSISNDSFAPPAAAINLPMVNINTNGVPIMDTTTNVPGTMTITSADGRTSYLPNSSDGDNTATFHVHGHSTALMPKLPYHIKLNTSLDLLSAMGLVCPYVTSSGKPTCDKSKSFILLANYDDKSLLRDWAASALANAIPIGNGYLNSPAGSPTPSGTGAPMPWAPHSLFVELYVNGAYEGNYQLIEEVKVDGHRIDINELSETDTSPSKVTGGYLLEIDQEQSESFIFQTPQGLAVGLVAPDFSPDPEVAEQISYISSYVDTAETALFSGNFTDPTQGWRAYFDEASAVNFYIVNDVLGNVDGGEFFSSDYLYKDKNNPLLYMGPIWDFDISSGNVNYQPIVDPTVPWMQTQAIWYEQWFKDAAFQADLVKQWNALRDNGVFTAWLASIQQQAQSLEQSQANNFARWPILGIEVWPNPEAAGSYDAEVGYLTNWLKLRIAYLDSLFNKRAPTHVTLDGLAETLTLGSPVTLSAHITGGTALTGEVSFLSNGILLGASTPDNSGAARLTTGGLPIGVDFVVAVYNGDNANALSVSMAQPTVVVAPLAATVTAIGLFPNAREPETSTGLIASVIGNSGAVVPTGIVKFRADGGPDTGVTLDNAGQARYSTGSLDAGTHTITARYLGDANYSGSSGTFTLSLRRRVALPRALGATSTQRRIVTGSTLHSE